MSSRSTIRFRWLHVLFALSGAAGLGLQLTWARRLSLGLGHEIPATYGVVTTFLLGLAAGAWMSDRRRVRRIAPPIVCGLVEAGAGLWAVATLATIPWLSELSWRLAGPSPGAGLHWTISFLLPAAALLPGTLAMGATLPAMERWVSEEFPDGRRVGPLYAANTAGAVVGILLAVGLLQPALGFRGATLVFAALNGVCACICLVAGISARDPNSTRKRAPFLPAADRIPVRLAATLFLTGLLGMGFEILTVRLLGQSLENTVYTYAAILAAYLSGTALGGSLRNRLAPRGVASIPTLLLALAGSLVLAAWVLLLTPTAHAQLRTVLGNSPAAIAASEFLVAASVLAIPTFLMGMLFSIVAQDACRRTNRLGAAVGWNTLGGSLAPLVVGLGFLPIAGSRWTLAALGLGYLFLLPGLRSLRIPGRVAALALLTALLGLPAGLSLQLPPPGARLTVVREGPGDTVAIVETPDGNRSLRVNNRFTMGGTASAAAERRHGHLPLLLHPDPHRVLFLGVGTGISFASLDAHPGVTADGVELVPETVALLGEFAPHNRFGTNLSVHVADARRFVRAPGPAYDVIIADLFHPARDGAGSLYTVEQFQAIRTRLAPGGVFCQWLPLFQLDLANLRTIVRTFLQVFPDADAFLLRFNADTPVLGLVGSTGSLKFDPATYLRRQGTAGVRESLRPLGLTDPLAFLGLWFAGPEWLRDLAGDAPLNIDDAPVVLFRAPRTLAGPPPPGHALLAQLLERPRPGGSARFAVSGIDPQWLVRLDAYERARDRYLAGLIAETSGNTADAESAFLESVRLSHDFTAGYSQLLSRASLHSRSDPPGARRLLDQLIDAAPDRPVARDLRTKLGL
ncbi:MAG: spermidine synthase [Verrucomicrobiota bacterium]